jgi:hypothetical protein
MHSGLSVQVPDVVYILTTERSKVGPKDNYQGICKFPENTSSNSNRDLLGGQESVTLNASLRVAKTVTMFKSGLIN